MMSALKSGAVTYSRFARIADMEEAKQNELKARHKITVDRSGGGL
jgi:glycerol-3-phosphate dehydrogenase